MGTELFTLLGTDPDDPRVRAATADAKAAERLIDTLVEMRHQQCITQREVAERMETTQSAVSKFERAGGDPRLSTLQRYARAVGGRLRCLVSTSLDDGNVWRRAKYQVLATVEDDPGYVDEMDQPAHIRLVS